MWIPNHISFFLFFFFWWKYFFSAVDWGDLFITKLDRRHLGFDRWARLQPCKTQDTGWPTYDYNTNLMISCISWIRESWVSTRKWRKMKAKFVEPPNIFDGQFERWMKFIRLLKNLRLLQPLTHGRELSGHLSLHFSSKLACNFSSSILVTYQGFNAFGSRLHKFNRLHMVIHWEDPYGNNNSFKLFVKFKWSPIWKFFIVLFYSCISFPLSLFPDYSVLALSINRMQSPIIKLII